MISLAAVSSVKAATSIIEGFPGMGSGGLNDDSIDGLWHGNATDWSISTNVLTHQGAGEGLVGQMVESTDSGSILKLSFDYNVGAGNTIYVHLRGFDATAANPSWSVNTWATVGNAWDTNVNGVTYNLHDGLLSTDSGSTNSGDFGEAVSFTGNGTAVLDIDLSGYAVSDAADYEYLMLGFAVNVSNGANASTISNVNLSVAVPEPSSAALLGLGGLALILRRRRD